VTNDSRLDAAACELFGDLLGQSATLIEIDAIAVDTEKKEISYCAFPGKKNQCCRFFSEVWDPESLI
jgi:hypothetical protein